MTISDAGEALTAQGPSVSNEFYAKSDEAKAFAQQPVTLTYKGTGSESGGVAGVLEVTDAEFGASEDRQLEMKACSKALAGLSSDVVQDLFTKTFNLALVQTECCTSAHCLSATEGRQNSKTLWGFTQMLWL